MGRIRTIKPEFFQHQELSSISAETHLLAAGLLCYADDDGYFLAHPELVKAAIFPLRESSLSAHCMLTELSRIGFVRLGTGADGKQYGQVVKFGEHQRVNRPTPSKIAKMQIAWGDFSEDSHTTHGVLSEGSLPEGKGREGKGREENPLSDAKKRIGRGEPSPAAKNLAALLESEILHNKADFQTSIRQRDKWAATADKMLRLDKRTAQDIEDVIRWAQHDEFWAPNVLSMDKLRKQFDQLQLKKKARSNGYSRPAASTSDIFTDNPATRALAQLRED